MDAMMMDGNSLGCVHFLRGKQGMDGHPGAHTQPFRQFKVHRTLGAPFMHTL